MLAIDFRITILNPKLIVLGEEMEQGVITKTSHIFLKSRKRR